MIERDSNMQTLRCTTCDESKSFNRGVAADPEKMFILAESMAADHAGCEKWKHDPDRARRERGVTKRMQREFEKLQCGKRMF